MNRYPMLETRLGKFAFGIFLFILLLLARDTLISSCIIGFTKSQFLMLGVICLFGIAFLIRNRKEWKQLLTDRRMLVFALSAAILLLPMLVKQDWQMMYLSILICLFFSAFLTYFISWQEVAKPFVIILTALSAYSLVGMYVLKDLALSCRINPPIFLNSAGTEFFNLGLTFVVPWEFWHRNFGIFREPGVYQFFLLLGLYLTHYGVRWKSRWQPWAVTAVLAATMLSTFAIGGFIEMGLLAIFVYLDKKWYRSKPGMFIGAAGLVAVAAVVVYIILQIRTPLFEQTIYYEFYDMFRRLTTDSDSLVDRIRAILTNVALFLRHPLFGDTIANVLHGTAHNTSSTLILFAALGIAGGTLNVAAWIAFAWRRERNVFGNLVLLVILFMSFNTQNLVADVFFWLFPYMALTEAVLLKLNRPERKV